MAQAPISLGRCQLTSFSWAVNVLIVLGGVAMLRRRLYGLAVAASILAMIQHQRVLLSLGLPFGIWSLMVLTRRSEVGVPMSADMASRVREHPESPRVTRSLRDAARPYILGTRRC